MKLLLYRNLAAIIDVLLAALFSAIGYLLVGVLFRTAIPYENFIFFVVYLSIPVLLKGKSVGKQLFHLKVIIPNTKNQYLILFLREVLIKLGVFLIVPYIIQIQISHANEYLAILVTVIVSAVINNIMYLFLKKHVWDALTGTSVQKEEKEAVNLQKPKMILKWLANSLDISIILIISMLTFLLLQRWVFIDFYIIVLVLAFCYFAIANFVSNTTVGKYVFGIELVFNPSKSKLYNVLIREVVYKFSPVIVLLILSKVLRLGYIYYNLLFIGFLYLLWLQLIKHSACWDLYTKTEKSVKKSKPRKNIIWGVALLIFYLLSFTVIKQLNNTYPTSDVQFFGVELYEYNKHHPVDKNVQAKVDYIKAHPTSAKDYVLQLFEKYDIVVLGERIHPEMTQYDLFYDIVSDPRFIQNVGHIFTEVGAAADYQYLSDEYFTTVYPDDSSLEKATACLLQHSGIHPMWDNTNIFNFFKKINLLNKTLPDSLKLKEYFTDCNWYSEDVKTPEDYKRRSIEHRDSLMADVVIRRFNEIKQTEKRKKCLLITNYRHSFNRTKVFSGPYFDDETSYIFKAFPDITANVLVHTVALTLPFMVFPINKSTWDKAFEICGNPSRGFDFENSPFGKDYFDLFPNFWQLNIFYYQDIYTGYVFYVPLKKFVLQHGIPYAMDNYRDEYKRKHYLKYGYADSLSVEKEIKMYYESGSHIQYSSDSKLIYLLFNYEIVLCVGFIIIGFCVVLLKIVSSLFKEIRTSRNDKKIEL